MIAITAVTPTPFLRCAGDALCQQVQVCMTCDETDSAEIVIGDIATSANLTPGEAVYDAELREIAAPCDVTVAVRIHGKIVAQQAVAWLPPKHWTVHVVQLSHHDVGYTDLACNVLHEHDAMLDAAIDMAAATRDWPDDARFRLVIEQAWSIDHFLKHARPERVAAMLDLLRTGDFELTALFGNLTTEMCGHETLARAVYHAFRLKREYGLSLLSAEHNDVPGFTWGLAQVLTEAGVNIFCPGLPKYYNWGHPDATSFWDEAALYGRDGMPGAFWWEAPGGKRVLFWCNNQGCGGDSHPAMPGLAPRLQQLAEQGYPYDVLRWPVQGGMRDNSPYIFGYAKTIRDWNERWAFPRLISSTNARFYADLLPRLPADLPVHRGELPGQDYPVGAASTAAATAVNRRNHADLPAAETLAAIAAALTAYPYQAETLRDAMEDVLWHDEHTWGHHSPAGPTAATAELEKALHAYRAATLAHDVTRKALAQLADAIHVDTPGYHLVVFNPAGQPRDGLVRAPMREFANCGITMVEMDGVLRSASLLTRHPDNPPDEFIAGKFTLVDVQTGAAIPYQLTTIADATESDPYAPQRLGKGRGGRMMGLFEAPAGILRDLCFHAEDVPALGYRVYRLQPCDEPPVQTPAVSTLGCVLDNAWYRLEIDPVTGAVRSLREKATGREWVDPAAEHPFGAFLVREPIGDPLLAQCVGIDAGSDGVVTAGLRVRLTAPGFPEIAVTYTLYAREPRIDVGVTLLSDATPLVESYLAFPFNLPGGMMTYEAPLCIINPSADLFPGAYADRITAQNWVRATDGAATILWSSLDAPVTSLGRLWPGRVSPAHSAVLRADIEHERPDVRGGAIYALLTANNFGTNFAVAQSGLAVFRFSFTTASEAVSTAQAAAWGRAVQSPFIPIFTAQSGARPLPVHGGFLSFDHPAVQVVAVKRAEDGRGLILRLWNTSDDAVSLNLELPLVALTDACLTSLAEEDGAIIPLHDAQHLAVALLPRAVVTVRLQISSRHAGNIT